MLPEILAYLKDVAQLRKPYPFVAQTFEGRMAV